MWPIYTSSCIKLTTNSSNDEEELSIGFVFKKPQIERYVATALPIKTIVFINASYDLGFHRSKDEHERLLTRRHLIHLGVSQTLWFFHIELASSAGVTSWSSISDVKAGNIGCAGQAGFAKWILLKTLQNIHDF